MSQTNFLIGRGELLTKDIKGPRRGSAPVEVYSFEEAVARLHPEFTSTAAALADLPQAACPHDYAVAKLTLNPGYIAKSYFPRSMFTSAGLSSVGSRRVRITPQRWKRKGDPVECSTTQIFVAGKRSSFARLSGWASQQMEGTDEAIELATIERFAPMVAADRIKGYADAQRTMYEVGVHLLPEDSDSDFIQQAFVSFLEGLGAYAHTDLALRGGSLWFVPVEASREQIDQLAIFSFLRVVRPMPQLRVMRPVVRAPSVPLTCALPTQAPLSSEPSVAILDGGLPDKHPLAPWLGGYRKLDATAKDDPDALAHGLAVTSAFLFGPLSPGGLAERPYSYVDHLRVLDSRIDEEDPLELYRTLGLIEQVLLTRQYEFINLSLGPDLPVIDDDVHAWTSVIDDHLQDGRTLVTVAVGNNGERDRAAGNARVQVPADCVNALAVGACDGHAPGWSRAPYSAIGPGRSPGVVKPDLVTFGGAPNHYFHALTEGAKPNLAPLLGTSFASPYLLRAAVGIRAILGSHLTPLAIKALLVHASENGDHDTPEVGWGKVPQDVMAIITCGAGVARIVYQGELKPGKYLRASLPLPEGGLKGRIKLKATFCYASPIDPQDACSYTQAGLEVSFRPNLSKVKEEAQNADTAGFFKMSKYMPEEERRSDIGKWETVLHAEKSMLGSSLQEPVFDIHYNARTGGGAAHRAGKIPYALVLTIEAARHADLYAEILKAYASTLVPIQPQVSIPIRGLSG
ncbi:MAG: S8 family peptidase [Lysobacteraceae bacterium]|nr:MAG: S8 family peptidase [Xanthomonadaceae bacterium]